MIGEAVLRFFEHNFDAPLVVQLLCIAFSAVLLLGVPAGTKIRPLRFALETVCLAAVFLLFNLVISVAAVLARLTFGSYWNYLLGIALYAAVRSRHSAAARMAMGCAVFAAAVLMASFGTICGNMIEFRVEGFDIAVTKVIASLLTVVCACVFYKYPLFRFELSGFDAALNTACNLLSAMLCIVYELMRLYNRDMHEASNALAGYISLVEGAMFIINIVTYFMTYYICREKERVLAYQAERQKTRSLEQLLTLSEARLAELREVRHDVKNQYAYMQSLLEQNKYDDLRAYFEELVGTFSKPLCDVVESGNVMVDQVLNLELSKVRSMGLKMDVRVAVPPELPFSQSGILALFTNVIDNAAEACVRDGFLGEQIGVAVGMKGDYLLFCVSNPTKKTVPEAEGETSKPDKKLHGFGAKIIKKVVKKYNGYYRCFIKDGQYVSEALLDTDYAKKAHPAGAERG